MLRKDITEALRDGNLLLIFSVTLMAVIPFASTSPAFNSLSKALGVSEGEVPSLLIFFTVPAVIMSPFLGAMADRIGRKKVLIPSLLLFGIAGGLCGFARDFQQLQWLTFFQGVGASALGLLNVTLIADRYKGLKMTRYMGYNNSILGIGSANYPLIGGFLAGFGWYYPFFLPFIAVIVALIAFFKLEEPLIEKQQSIKEYLVSSVGILKDSRIYALLVLSGAPFIFLFGVMLSYFPFLVSSKVSIDPMQVSIFYAVLSYTAVLVSSSLGWLTTKINMRKLLAIAYFLYSISLFGYISSPELPVMYAMTILYGIAHGISIPGIAVLFAEAAPEAQRGAFMSAYRMSMLLGQALGPAITTFVYESSGMDYVFYCAGAIALLSIIPALLAKTSTNNI